MYATGGPVSVDWKNLFNGVNSPQVLRPPPPNKARPKCPLCGSTVTYVGATSVDCSNYDCMNHPRRGRPEFEPTEGTESTTDAGQTLDVIDMDKWKP
jgi:hypothetical protein